MGEQAPKTHISAGLLAHVDAGKTTLSEALLYCSGARRTLGRVDHGDAFLDTHEMERKRGITIFSKLARLSVGEQELILVDTPGHVDFSAEAERTMPILDCAVLVISGTDGVQAHTVTLWRLLERYSVPVFLFINKMDLPGTDRQALLSQLRQKLSDRCADLQDDAFLENAALCDEALLDNYLQTGTITDANIRGLVEQRRLFPCCFGSALRLQGIDSLLQALQRFAPRREYPRDFAARVYKISRDPQGNRLTWLKVTGGSLRVRAPLAYRGADGKEREEKPQQLRLYSAERFITPETVEAGQLCAVTGLSDTYAGQGLGAQSGDSRPVLEPVMTYRILLPAGCDPVTVLPKLRQLEEEDPQLHILYDSGQIHVQIMGKVQLEVLRSLIAQRFGLSVTLDQGKVYYKETIAEAVEGVGHFEPLRHYAEVHLLLEPLSRGSGLEFATRCPTDVLEANYQSLVLTHLEEKLHKGVLTGAPITDMRLTLLIGRAHQKHTEGGDFRQATYRAVRQGLMQAKSILLEPWYDFTLTVPTAQIGRAITDIRAMSGRFDTPQAQSDMSILTGQVSAAALADYADQVAAYTQGKGQLQVTLRGYEPCHDQQAVVEASDYDPTADTEDPPGSVFCNHGAGFHVPWDQVREYMHLDSGWQTQKAPVLLTRNLQPDDRALQALLEREFATPARELYRPPADRPATEKLTIRPLRPRYYLVDGYNMIFAWQELAGLAREDLDAARRWLIDRLISFAGFQHCPMTIVFDGYKRKGSTGEKTGTATVQIVYTREGETADSYIQSLAAQIGRNYHVCVATSDALVQLSSLGSGVLRMSARELHDAVEDAHRQMKKYFGVEKENKS